MSPASPARAGRGVTPARARQLLRAIPGIEEATSYGLPAYKLNGTFFARFRDEDTVLVLMLSSIGDRDVLMQLDPRAFFFTEHYRNYPTVLIRLAEVSLPALKDVLSEARGAAEQQRPKRKRS